nr:hypothetical protein SHINE37_60136 [Rhizobiaceae bacterium]
MAPSDGLSRQFLSVWHPKSRTRLDAVSDFPQEARAGEGRGGGRTA